MPNRIKVTFEAEVPVEWASMSDTEAWVRFCLHANGELSEKNPLVDSELEADFLHVKVESCNRTQGVR